MLEIYSPYVALFCILKLSLYAVVTDPETYYCTKKAFEFRARIVLCYSVSRLAFYMNHEAFRVNRFGQSMQHFGQSM